jgi:hypothetical protein
MMRLTFELYTTEQAGRDMQAVVDAISFARRWAESWATWCICLESILNEHGYDCRAPDWR